MIPLDVALLFTGVALALALVPGPDNIFVLTQSALHGRLAGVFVTLGLATGLIFHTTAVAFGVAALVQASHYAFTVLKFIGAAYLLYLAWQAFAAGKNQLEAHKTAVETPSRLYRRGVIMNIANPKITIFFLAFLPQFVDPAFGPMVPQLYQLGGLMILATLLVFGTVALAAGFLGDWLRQSEHAQSWINKASGVVFASLAIKLALTQK